MSVFFIRNVQAQRKDGEKRNINENEYGIYQTVKRT